MRHSRITVGGKIGLLWRFLTFWLQFSGFAVLQSAEAPSLVSSVFRGVFYGVYPSIRQQIFVFGWSESKPSPIHPTPNQSRKTLDHIPPTWSGSFLFFGDFWILAQIRTVRKVTFFFLAVIWGCNPARPGTPFLPRRWVDCGCRRRWSRQKPQNRAKKSRENCAFHTKRAIFAENVPIRPRTHGCVYELLQIF